MLSIIKIHCRRPIALLNELPKIRIVALHTIPNCKPYSSFLNISLPTLLKLSTTVESLRLHKEQDLLAAKVKRSLSDCFEWLKEMFLFAAPKQKRSKHRRDVRRKAFALKNRQDIQQCYICNEYKLMNHICPTCFQRYKQYVREHIGRSPFNEVK